MVFKNFEELDKKHKSANRENMSRAEEESYVNDCFDTYESMGFAETFGTPYDGEARLVGMKFEVLGRVPTLPEGTCEGNGAELECQPMWNIRLENGEEIAAYPEEICKAETEKYM